MTAHWSGWVRLLSMAAAAVVGRFLARSLHWPRFFWVPLSFLTCLAVPVLVGVQLGLVERRSLKRNLEAAISPSDEARQTDAKP
jgi:hypothetical protein